MARYGGVLPLPAIVECLSLFQYRCFGFPCTSAFSFVIAPFASSSARSEQLLNQS